MGFIINPYLVQPSTPAFTGILDTYTGSAAAYSLRRLSSSYTGSLIRVRRSNDNAEQDIGYTVGNILDESALTTFVGSNSAFITTWYDQSGNGRNVTRTTAIEQPRIVNSGTIETDGSKPAVNFDSYKPLTYSTGVSYSAAAIVARVTTATTVNYAVGGTGVGLFYNGSAGAGIYGLGGYDGSNVGTLLTADLNRHLGWFNMTSSRLYVIRDNGSLTDLSAFASSISMGNSTDGIGGRDIGSDVLCFRGKMQEVILWSSQQASNATGIRSNINTFYSIY